LNQFNHQVWMQNTLGLGTFNRSKLELVG